MNVYFHQIIIWILSAYVFSCICFNSFPFLCIVSLLFYAGPQPAVIILG